MGLEWRPQSSALGHYIAQTSSPIPSLASSKWRASVSIGIVLNSNGVVCCPDYGLLLIHVFNFCDSHAFLVILIAFVLASLGNHLGKSSDSFRHNITPWIVSQTMIFYLFFFANDYTESWRGGTSVPFLLLHCSPAWHPWLVSEIQEKDNTNLSLSQGYCITKLNACRKD